MARVGYVALFFANATAAGLLRVFGQSVLSRFHLFSECEHAEYSSYCVGNQIVYRMSFSLSSFFLLTTLLSCAVARGCEGVCCMLLFQLPFYAAMLFGSLFIPNDFFDGYVDVARVVSAVFIILQIIIILDSTYNLRDFILDKMDEADCDEDVRTSLLSSRSGSTHSDCGTKTMWEVVYLALVFVCATLSIAGVVVMCMWYTACDLNMAFILVTVVSVVVLTALSVTEWANMGLLPSTTVSLYLVFLCLQTVRANPDATCSSSSLKATQQQLEQSGVITNALVAAFTITWTSWRTSATSTSFFGSSSPSSGRQRLHEAEDEDLASIGLTSERLAKDVQSNVNEVPEYQFHVLMVLASLYMAMVLTNWSSPDGTSTEDDQKTTMWVKAISQWVATALFFWTLVAPSIFPGRDFDHL